MKMKLFLATLIAGLATALTVTSAGACPWAGLEETECPASLIEE